jgi:hypothetical protein
MLSKWKINHHSSPYKVNQTTDTEEEEEEKNKSISQQQYN